MDPNCQDRVPDTDRQARSDGLVEGLQQTGFAALLWPGGARGGPEGPQLCPDPDSLRDGLAGEGRALLICLPVLQALAPRADRPVLQALADWRRAAQDWLAVQRAFRAVMRVVELPATATVQTDLARALPGWPALPCLEDLPDPVPGDSLQALAGLALAQDRPARDLLAALQAASTGPYTELPGFEGLLTLLTAQARATADLQTHAQTLETRAGQLGAAQDMRDVLLDQVEALQQAYRDAVADQSRITQERSLLDQSYRQQVADLQGELGAVYASRSWRITAPMRAVVRRVRGG